MPLTPSIAEVFFLYDGSGAPLAGVVPVFNVYENLLGIPISQPTIVEIGSGAYGFDPAASDIANGTCYIVDGTVAANPRYAARFIQPIPSVSADLATVLAIVTEILNIQVGRWNLDGITNQLVIYGPDNTTEIARFNTYNALGIPATVEITERRAV